MTERDIFIAALQQEDPARRQAYLDEACERQPELRRQVEDLLRLHEGAGSFLEEPAAESAITRPFRGAAEHASPQEAPGTVIGPFKLLEQIGEGGFGVVFLAEQTQPVCRKVALKILKPGMDTRQVVARFEAERQALALMDHPNIARIYDGGTTPDGLPFFVMELVKGVPVTDYCDRCGLTTRERLDLFLLVCRAVQHAHQKGVIHRDIKPSNVLVAIQDGRPAVKVIDFGVAKAVDQRLSEHTLQTGYHQMIGTPLYMSPEQAEMSPLDVDTRADIYSLGVLLYELLTGTTPFEKERLGRAGYDEFRRIVREEEPPRPSARLSTLQDGLTAVAAQRRTEPRHLLRAVRGELDWIVMKCLEKDRNRRYETAAGLARDLQRYLDDEPVQACPPTAGYRLRKFVRRNRVGFVAAVGVTTAVLVGLGVSTWQAIRASKAEGLAAERLAAEAEAGERAKANEARAVTEARRATAVADLLQKMLASANPEVAQKSGVTARELLDAFAAGLGDQLEDQPEVEATIRQVIGRAYWRLDLNAAAAPQLERAVALRRQTPGTDPKLLAESLAAWGRVLFELKRHTPARAALEEARALHRQAGSPPRAVLEALVSLQMVARAEKRFDEAARLLAGARELARALPGGDDPGLACMLHVQAFSLREAGQLEEAEQLAREAVAMHRRTRKPSDVELAHGLAEWSRCLQAMKRYDEAEAPVKEALAIFRVHFPDDHPSVESVRVPLVHILQFRGKSAEADRILADRPREPLTPDRRDLTGWLSWAEGRRAAGQWELAWQGYSEAARLARPADGAAHARIGSGLLAVVRGLRGWSKSKDALPAARQAVAILEQVLADDPVGTEAVAVKEALANGSSILGETLIELDHHSEAVEAYRKAIAQWREVRAADPKRTWLLQEEAFFTCRLSEALLAVGRSEEAMAAAREGLRLHEKLLAGAPDNQNYEVRLLRAYGVLIVALEDQGKLDEGAAAFRAALRAKPATASARRHLAAVMNARAYELATGPDGGKRDPGRAIRLAKEAVGVAPEHADCWNALGVAHYRAGDWNEAIAALRKSRELRTDNAEWSNPFFLAMAHWRLGDKDEARRWYDTGVEWMEKWASRSPSLIRFRDGCPDAGSRGKEGVNRLDRD